MSSIFDNINTLDCLKDVLFEKENSKAQVSTDKLESYAQKLYNIPNASQTVTEWLNILIEEYNRKYSDFDVLGNEIEFK